MINDKKIVLSAKKIRKTYLSPEKVTVLKDISLELPENTSIAIAGSSGEGKTTLLYILGTLEKADTGSLTIMDTPVKDRETIRNKHLGFIFQSYNLLEDFTTLENVLIPARIARKNTSKSSPLYHKGMELLKKVGLEKRANFPAKVLSGGEKQRVAIARSLCNDPDIILADEPSGNLDHYHSQAIHELLLSCVQEQKASLIVVTHDKELAGMCNQSYLLEAGQLSLK